MRPEFDWDGVVLSGYLALIEQWISLDLSKLTDDDLLRGIAELAEADGRYWFGSTVNLGLSRATDTAFDRLLKTAPVRRGLPQPQPVSASFLRGFDSRALDAQADLEALANAIRESDELRDRVLSTDANLLFDMLADMPEGQPVLESIQNYLDEYGHQIYSLDFVAPTQSENPLPILLSLKALVATAPEQDVRTRQAEMARERDELVSRTMQSLDPVTRRFFGWLWKWTKEYAPYRESIMFNLGAAWPTLRRLAAELGQRLVDYGSIAVPEDVYYLESFEIEQVIDASESGLPPPDYGQMAAERRGLRLARMQLAPPPVVPEGGTMKFGPVKMSMFDPVPEISLIDGAVLKGYAVSTGKVTAPASVVRSAEEFDRMKPGTILVCTTTTPAWTPLFSQAIGLVTDVGGALAHGSIVAREYGIPAVMGTGVATQRIKTGMLLTVDGDAGTVTLEEVS